MTSHPSGTAAHRDRPVGPSPKEILSARNLELHRAWTTLSSEADLSDPASEARRTARLAAIANEVVEVNRGLVKRVVHRFVSHRNRTHNEEFFAAGYEGLWTAFTLWEPDVAPFLSFAYKHISGRVMREVAHWEYPWLSYGDFCKRPAVLEAVERLTGKLGRAPSDKEVACDTGLTSTLVGRVRSGGAVPFMRARSQNWSRSGRQKAGHVVFTSSSTTSESDPDALLDRYLRQLSPKESWVWRARHGDEPQSLVAVAAELGIGRERLRRIDLAATKKLAALAAAAS